LLGGDYKKLAAYRLKQGRNANERHKQQKRGKVSTLSESNQGKHLNRLLAKTIVEVVQEFKAGILALPDLTGLRESLQSELEAKAEWKHPGDRAKQDEYEKDYKTSVHRWPYKQLTQCIEERAVKVGVPTEQRKQPAEGDFKEKAVQIAWSVYRAHRKVGT
jgi:transposase